MMKPKYNLSFAELAEISGENISTVKDFYKDQPSRDISSNQIKSFFKSQGFKYPTKSFAFINLKGGVGKTTSAVTLASRAVQFGFKTCILDLDAQGSATLSLDVSLDENDLIFHSIWQNPKANLPDALKTIEENFYVLASDLENSLLDVSLMNPAAQKKAVNDTINRLKDLGFEIIIVDCPPSLGAAVISSICAVDEIVIPVANDAFSFKGIELTTAEIKEIRSTFGLKPLKIHVLSTMVDQRLNLSKEYKEKLNKKFGNIVLPFHIRTSSDFSKALEKRETVFAVSKKTNAKADYDEVARHLFGFFPSTISNRSKKQK
jgi:chromosome partitioning protein